MQKSKRTWNKLLGSSNLKEFLGDVLIISVWEIKDLGFKTKEHLADCIAR